MKSEFTKEWIIENSVEIVSRYDKGILTLRSLHYQLVGLGMTNDDSHYKKVVNSMIEARWNNIISFDTFSDHEREVLSESKHLETDLLEEIERAKRNIRAWMQYYSKNKWENQKYYVEIFIEKKALQGVFLPVCERNGVLLSPCKGYPSLTFLNEASERIKEVQGNKEVVILYFGDYDPSGDDIPRSIELNLKRFGCIFELNKVMLNLDQIKYYRLPHAPTKKTDTRAKNWDGIGQVELDAVKPEILEELLQEEIDNYFDFDVYEEIVLQEEQEINSYRIALKEYVQGL